jgi:hypothetical protein
MLQYAKQHEVSIFNGELWELLSGEHRFYTVVSVCTHVYTPVLEGTHILAEESLQFPS